MKARRKINDISEIWDGKKLLIKDFTNLDLEGLDLSVIPEEYWKDVAFENTSVKNTGIKLPIFSMFSWLNNWYGRIIRDCDFSDNDLASYAEEKQEKIIFGNCNFSNTNISKYIYGYDNVLDQSCTEYDLLKSTASEIYSTMPIITLGTIIKNPQLKVSTKALSLAIKKYFRSNEPRDFDSDKRKKYNELFKFLEEVINTCNNTDMAKVYKTLKKMKFHDKLAFFKYGLIDGKKIKNLTVENLEFPFDLEECSLDNLTIRGSLGQLTDNFHNTNFKRSTRGITNEMNNIVMPDIRFDNWREKTRERIGQTPFTFRTNLYLELGRACNARCVFCRNHSLEEHRYDLDGIISTVTELNPYLNNIVIGGGEPTLKLDDLKRIREFLKPKDSVAIFTNGSMKNMASELEDYSYNYNISRHHFYDWVNAKILGLSEDDVIDSYDLPRFIEEVGDNYVTLCATCFKGGLDSAKKIVEYVDYCQQLGCRNILISDLHRNASVGNRSFKLDNLYIDDNVFPKAMERLFEMRGYSKKTPIYSTGGYVSTVLEDVSGRTVAFKHYISSEELEREWPRAIKRTFDLSIDPEGNLYENWHQTSGKVKSIGQKK